MGQRAVILLALADALPPPNASFRTGAAMTSPTDPGVRRRHDRPSHLKGLLEERLANGVRVVVLPTPAARPKTGLEPVAIELWVMAGTSAERREEHGCAHLLEHMLFKPTPARSTDLAGAIEALGGDVNAFTSHDETVFHATLPARSVDKGLQALGAAIVDAEFDPDALREEAQVVVEEIRQYRDDAPQRVAQELFTALYPRHSYGRPVLGTETDVLSHTAERLGSFHRHAYAGARVWLVVVGPVAPKRILRSVRQLLGRLPRARRMPLEKAPLPPKTSQVRVMRDDVEEAHVILGWQLPPFSQPAACALELASLILGHGEASRLVSVVRRRRQLVSSIHAGAYASRQVGTLMVSAHTQSARVEDAVEAILGEVDALASHVADDEEVERARAQLESDLIYGLETVQGRAHALGYYASLSGRVDVDQAYYAMIAAQTKASIRDACAKWLRPDRVALSVLLPARDVTSARAAAVRRRLERLSRQRRSSSGVDSHRDRHGIVHAELPGGLRIRAQRRPNLPMAAGWLVWPGGLRLERERDAGATSLIARVLNRGTPERSGDEMARELAKRAASVDGFAGRNSAGLHFESLASDLPFVLRRTFECALTPAFEDDEVEEERRVTVQELRAVADDLAQVAIRAMLDDLYGKHPFHRPRAGTIESVRDIQADRLRRLWTSNYPVGRAVLSLVGDFDFEALVDMVAGVVRGDDAPPRVPKWPGGSPRWGRTRERWIHRKREQIHIAMGFPALALGAPAAEVLDVTMAILGGQSGRLFQALREREGLVYHVAADSTEGVDAGHVTVYAATSPEKFDRCRAAIFRELDHIVQSRVSQSELDRAKAWLLGQFEASLQRRSRVAALMAFDEAYGMGAAHYQKYPDRIRSVTGKAVRELAERIFDARRRVTSIVGPTAKG